MQEEEERELLVIDNFSKEINYPINDISDNTPCQWCSIHNLKTENTMDCRLHIQRSRP